MMVSGYYNNDDDFLWKNYLPVVGLETPYRGAVILLQRFGSHSYLQFKTSHSIQY